MRVLTYVTVEWSSNSSAIGYNAIPEVRSKQEVLLHSFDSSWIFCGVYIKSTIIYRSISCEFVEDLLYNKSFNKFETNRTSRVNTKYTQLLAVWESPLTSRPKSCYKRRSPATYSGLGYSNRRHVLEIAVNNKFCAMVYCKNSLRNIRPTGRKISFSHSSFINVYLSSPGRRLSVMGDLFHEVGGASHIVSDKLIFDPTILD
jgi:hypothetical protein